MNYLKNLTLLWIVSFTALFCVVLTLPEIVPVHINSEMQIDRYGSRWITMIPAIISLVVLLIVWIVVKNNTKSFKNRIVEKLLISTKPFKSRKMEEILISLAIGFCIIISWVPIAVAKYEYVPGANRLLMPAMLFVMGVFMTIVSNYFPRIKRNSWIGIRTPWTLMDETVWNKTHKLGGYTCVAGGLILCIFSMLSIILDSISLAKFGLKTFICLCLIPCIYSFVEYYNVRSNKENTPTGPGSVD